MGNFMSYSNIRNSDQYSISMFNSEEATIDVLNRSSQARVWFDGDDNDDDGDDDYEMCA